MMKNCEMIFRYIWLVKSIVLTIFIVFPFVSSFFPFFQQSAHSCDTPEKIFHDNPVD